MKDYQTPQTGEPGTPLQGPLNSQPYKPAPGDHITKPHPIPPAHQPHHAALAPYHRATQARADHEDAENSEN